MPSTARLSFRLSNGSSSDRWLRRKNRRLRLPERLRGGGRPRAAS